MPPGDVKEQIAQLAATMSSVEAVLDLDGMRKQLASLEEEAADPDLWNDQDRAQSAASVPPVPELMVTTASRGS